MKARCRIILTSATIIAARVERTRRGWAVHATDQRDLRSLCALNGDIDWSETVAAIIAAATACAAEQLPVDLIIPARWCYIHELHEYGNRFSATAAAFAFEEFLPLPLEQVTTAFLPNGNESAWAIAVRTAPMKHLLDELSATGHVIDGLYVDAFVASHAAASGRDTANGLILVDDVRLTLMQRDGNNSTPSTLRTLLRPAGMDAAEFTRQQCALALATSGTNGCAWQTCDLTVLPAHNHDETDGDDEAQLNDGPALTALDLLAADLGNVTIPNLRRGALAEGTLFEALASPLMRLLTLVAVLMLVFASDQRIELGRVNADIESTRRQQIVVYREAFPEGVLRAHPALQLASERRRLEAVTGNRSTERQEGSTHDAPTALLDDLRDFVANLPEDVRVQLMEVTLDAPPFAIRGHTVDHHDAERIAEAANRLPNCTARPPRTSRVRTGGIEFSIRATRGSRHATH